MKSLSRNLLRISMYYDGLVLPVCQLVYSPLETVRKFAEREMATSMRRVPLRQVSENQSNIK
jgi:hypothetical protein